MRRGTWAGLGLAAVILVTAGTLASLATGKSAKPTAAAKPTAVAAATPVFHAVSMTPAQTYAYWTPQRMAAAKEVPASPASPQGTQPTSATATGPSGTSPGWAPASLREGPNGPAAPAAGASGAQPLTECYECFVPYTRWYYFAKYRTFPVSTVAKFFFSNNGGNYVCSGAVLYTNLVDTAGHCVVNTDGAHVGDSSGLICPSYNAGVNPAVGCWALTGYWYYNAWANNNSFEWDFGSAITSTCGTVHCNSIASTTGYLGYAYGQAYDQDFTAFGYPQAAPFDGNYIVVCNSQYGYQENSGNTQGGALDSSIGCDTTGGTSGGPWIIGFGGSNYLNGHNDWRYNALPQQMNSPYYDSRWCTLINTAGRPCS